MIKSFSQFKRASIQLARWKQLRSRTQSMLKTYFDKSGPKKITEIDSIISLIELELSEFNSCFRSESLNLGTAVALGENLVRARLTLGWTQNELASQSGFTRQQISKYELNNYAQTKLSSVAFLAAIMQIELTEREAAKNTTPQFQ